MPTRRFALTDDGLTEDGSGGIVLLVLDQPGDADVREALTELDLPPEAGAHLEQPHLRPQLATGDGFLAVAVKTPTLDEASDVELGEVVALVTPDAALLVGHDAGTVVEDVLEALQAGAALPAGVLLALIDVISPDLDEVLFGLDEDVADVEGHVFSAERADHSQQIYKLKRELLELRRAVVPLAGVVDRLAAEASCPVPDELREDFRGLHERVARTADGVEHLDGLISSVLDAQLAQIGVRQNEDQRKISAWAAIALVPTVVGGIYGMNFEHMPELSWQYGYPAALTLIAASCTALYAGFRRNRWL